MSSAQDDAPDAAEGTQGATEPGTHIELVSTTGARDLAVLIYRSADLDPTAFAPGEPTVLRAYGLAVRLGRSVGSDEAERHEVWRTSTRFDADRSSAMAWIMAIAHRRAVDRLRSARDTTSPPPPAPARSLGRRARRNAHQDRHSRNDLATHAEVVQVRRALALLDPTQREQLELVYFERYAADRPDGLAAIMTTLVTARLPRPDPPESLETKGSAG
jgi:RNA polymerase sigma-70 factor (ECF subfamily)